MLNFQKNAKIKVALLLIFILSVGLYASLKNRIVIKTALQFITQNHFSPKKINNNFSEELFDFYLKRVDPGKRFFTKKEINDFSVYRDKLDDQLKDGDDTFRTVVMSVYRSRIEMLRDDVPELLDVPFDFEKDDFIVIDNDLKDYAENDEELMELWRLQLKNQALTNYLSLLTSEKVPTENRTVLQLDLEKKARKKTREDMQKTFERLLKETEDEQFAFYLETVAGVFDPHTVYMLPEKKEDFDIGLRGSLEGIGAVLSEKDEYIEVVQIIIGGPAWKQKDLEAKDIILKVAQADEEPVSIVNMRVQDAVQLIRGDKGTEVRLTVKKESGEIKEISILRDVVVLEETYAKSTIINQHDLGLNVGYIHLPRFYRDFEDKSARNSSTDILNALTELDAENVDGIILDLRNNGGGALEDAITMTGHFIKTGPVVQVWNGRNQSYIAEDYDPSIAYKGPLIVLVNSYSASASEIVTAALQDYHRAIIIGTESTYGKGTVQTLKDLDEITRVRLPFHYQNYNPIGSVKLTIQKFYRINGGSTQFAGVEPDIVLPFTTDFMEIGEKELDFALPWSNVPKRNYTLWETDRPYLTELKRRSAERIKNNDFFNEVSNYVTVRSERKEQELETLNLAYRLEEQDEIKEENKHLEDLIKPIPALRIPSPNYIGDGAEERNEKTANWNKEIKKDPYINEAIFVLNDWLQLAKAMH